MRQHVLTTAIGLCLAAFVIGDAAAQTWREYIDPVYGTRALYPAELFTAIESADDVPARVFLSPDRKATLSVGAWDNRRGETAAEYRTRLLDDRDYGKLTYAPTGRTWFVLSGHRGADIYYEKVMLSCGGTVVNVLALSYPRDQRELYAGTVEKLEDNFKSGTRRC